MLKKGCFVDKPWKSAENLELVGVFFLTTSQERQAKIVKTLSVQLFFV